MDGYRRLKSCFCLFDICITLDLDVVCHDGACNCEQQHNKRPRYVWTFDTKLAVKATPRETHVLSAEVKRVGADEFW
jgi:hypothetical protein